MLSADFDPYTAVPLCHAVIHLGPPVLFRKSNHENLQNLTQLASYGFPTIGHLGCMGMSDFIAGEMTTNLSRPFIALNVYRNFRHL